MWPFNKKSFSKYGWKPDTPDHRDFLKVSPPVSCPTKVDLRTTGLLPEVWNQGQLGSCVAHSTGAAFDFCLGKSNKSAWMPSRLFIYYNARAIENSINSDNGCMIRDAVKQLNALGVCHEDIWPYSVNKFASKPTAKCYAQASLGQIVQYSRVAQTQRDIEATLAQGFPICCGISIYESFESEVVAKSGMVPMPLASEPSLGGHAVLIVGYDHAKRLFIMRNSWGTEWGDKGHFYISYDYLLNKNLADDFWVLQQVELTA